MQLNSFPGDSCMYISVFTLMGFGISGIRRFSLFGGFLWRIAISITIAITVFPITIFAISATLYIGTVQDSTEKLTATSTAPSHREAIKAPSETLPRGGESIITKR